MDNIKIRFTVGAHSFEAEGSAEMVNDLFKEWKAMVGSPAASEKGTVRVPPAAGGLSSGAQLALGGFEHEQLAHIFNTDEKRDLITLRVLPTGEDRHREAVLLMLYGYLRLKGQDEVLVTKLKGSLVSSGSAPDRIDSAAIPSVREGFLVKGGSGKGGKYRLTNKGIARCEDLIKVTLEQLI